MDRGIGQTDELGGQPICYPAPLRDLWSGQRESNPPIQLGRLLLHLGAIPAKLLDDEPQNKEAAFPLFKPTYKPGWKINMAFAAGVACQAFWSVCGIAQF